VPHLGEPNGNPSWRDTVGAEQRRSVVQHLVSWLQISISGVLAV